MITEYSNEVENYIYNEFKDLKFEEERHLYSIINNGKLIYLPSVSSLVDSFCYKFDENKRISSGKTLIEASANKASIERGQKVTTSELRAEWRKKNKDACDLGHKTHTFLEKYTGIENPVTPQEIAGVKYLLDLRGKYRISFRELRAYSKRFLFAGTMDLPLQLIEGNTYEIHDYKTNMADLFKSYSMLKPPFETMEATPYNKYQIQLSYYQLMLEEIGIRVSGRRLVHLKDDSTYKLYPLYDLTDILRDYHENLKLTA